MSEMRSAFPFWRQLQIPNAPIDERDPERQKERERVKGAKEEGREDGLVLLN